MSIWNGEVLAIHLTEQCNLKCPYCYLHSRERLGKIDFEAICIAVEKIKPDTLFMYGGEPLLCKDTLRRTIEYFPDKNLIVVTNGSLLTEQLMDYFINKNVAVIISLDSFDYRRNNTGRQLTTKQFNRILEIIHNYKKYGKLVLMCNIHEQTDDFPDFHKTTEELGLRTETYLIISGAPCDITTTPFYRQYKSYPESVIKALTRRWERPNTMPKLRLHCNGMISRALISKSEYDICHVSKWEPRMKNLGELPYPQSCERCSAFHCCYLMHTFPYWAYELEQKGVLHYTFACQASKLLAEEVLNDN